MDKHRVHVAMARFWRSDLTPEELFAGLPFLFEHFEFVLSPDPDFLLFSVFPGDLPTSAAVRIFYTGENVRPDFAQCDWAFSFDYDEELGNPRHLRLPNYKRLGAGSNLIKSSVTPDTVLAEKTRFCNFVYHNDVDLRNRFFSILSKYKQVDAPGRCCNNMAPIGSHPDPVHSRFAAGKYQDKVDFLRSYKFTIAFENASYPGYTTEKIYHAMLAQSLPIYWGNPLVHRDFNPKSFVNGNDFQSLEELAEFVIELDRNDSLYLQHLREPWYPGNQLTPYVDDSRILARFHEIFGQ